MAKKLAKKTEEQSKATSPSNPVLVRPLMTEKASRAGVHVFEVDPSANKATVSQAIQAAYKVTPRQINIQNRAGKRVYVRGKLGRRTGMKKAIVYLKPGETITTTAA